ncbi:MAG: hypothetical protein HOW73_37310 [Polyangiaceae bacterium]|nr:hypothetical protein [Polyangiaceae bacterium]
MAPPSDSEMAPRRSGGLARAILLLAIAGGCEADSVLRGRSEDVAASALDPPTPAPVTTATAAAESAIAAPTPFVSAPPIASSIASVMSAEASAEGSASAAPATEGVDPLVVTLERQTVNKDFSQSPFYFTAAFDGSLRYSLWLRALEFARAMKAKHGKAPHLTFFVNAAFYTTQPGKSDVGKAMSRAEVLVRRALTQQAINEGHDIGDHGMGHLDGRTWDKARWLEEIDRFRGTMSQQLFVPILDGEGQPVFPKFQPLPDAESRATGAACETNADCTSGQCLRLTEATRVCTQPCNLKQHCPTGSACGAPMFRQDTDVCIPLPAFPVELDGKTLFNDKGEPNRKHPRLVPYSIVGYRAPYLAANDALYEALAERGYLYDTSQSASPGPPFYFLSREKGRKILQFALMLYPGGRTIPMDYNYARLKVPGTRMKNDYESAVLSAYSMGRLPWNVGHHFAMWEDGAYLDALESTVDMVLGGCPDAAGALRCEGGEVVSFRELAQRMQ